MAELPERTEPRTRGKSASIYSIISAQAGGVSDALLRVIASAKLDEFKGALYSYITRYDSLCLETSKKTTTKGLGEGYGALKDILVTDGKLLIDSWKASLGLQMGTAFMGLQETYWGYPQLLSIIKSEEIDASIRPILERYFLSTYKTNAPDVRLAFKMLMEKQISRTEFNQYCQWEGWAEGWHDKLYEILNKEPDEYLAFSMYKRGLLTKAEFYECLSIAGYDASWHPWLEQALHRRPTYRELINLADFVPLSTMWVTEVLRAQGYTDGDIAYIVPAIELRPLREEVRSVVGRLLWQYQLGRRTRESLEEELTDLELQPKEIELILAWADLRYEDALTDNKVEIIRSRVEAGDPALQTQEAIKTELVALGIAEEMANLMAEDWYYDYIYTP